MGVEVYQLTAEEMEVFKAKAAPIYEKYKNTIGQELIEMFGYTF